jgi:hypothetical protein
MFIAWSGNCQMNSGHFSLIADPDGRGPVAERDPDRA